MDTTHVEGEEVYLHVQVKGHPTPSLNWYHDGVVLSRMATDRKSSKFSTELLKYALCITSFMK